MSTLSEPFEAWSLIECWVPWCQGHNRDNATGRISDDREHGQQLPYVPVIYPAPSIDSNGTRGICVGVGLSWNEVEHRLPELVIHTAGDDVDAEIHLTHAEALHLRAHLDTALASLDQLAMSVTPAATR
jgi:hypothetical protein